MSEIVFTLSNTINRANYFLSLLSTGGEIIAISLLFVWVKSQIRKVSK